MKVLNFLSVSVVLSVTLISCGIGAGSSKSQKADRETVVNEIVSKYADKKTSFYSGEKWVVLDESGDTIEVLDKRPSDRYMLDLSQNGKDVQHINFIGYQQWENDMKSLPYCGDLSEDEKNKLLDDIYKKTNGSPTRLNTIYVLDYSLFPKINYDIAMLMTAIPDKSNMDLCYYIRKMLEYDRTMRSLSFGTENDEFTKIEADKEKKEDMKFNYMLRQME